VGFASAIGIGSGPSVVDNLGTTDQAEVVIEIELTCVISRFVSKPFLEIVSTTTPTLYSVGVQVPPAVNATIKNNLTLSPGVSAAVF
jgi:hypothetical protein